MPARSDAFIASKPSPGPELTAVVLGNSRSGLFVLKGMLRNDFPWDM